MNKAGILIRQAREEAGLTRYELCKRAGIQQTHLKQIEEGVTDPSVGVFMAILEALERTIKIERV